MRSSRPRREALAECIRRANRFREAGADCLFAPGASDLATIRTLVREIAGRSTS